MTSLNALHGMNVQATDGAIGTVARLLIDLTHWAVRYLVVDVRSWRTSHEVLVSPMSVVGHDGQVTLSLSRQMIPRSPRYDPSQRITRDQESALLGFFSYPEYWYGPYLWGPAPIAREAGRLGGLLQRPEARRPALAAKLEVEREANELADSRDIIGIHLHARDGDIGHVGDLLVDEDSWRLRYLVVDTSSWWGGRDVLVAAGWIDHFDLATRRLDLTASRNTVKKAPAYDDIRGLVRKSATLSEDRHTGAHT